MIDFYNNLKIKHVDIPYMLFYAGIFLVIIIPSLFLFTIGIVIFISICCLLLLIITLTYHFFRAREAIAMQQQQKYQAYLSLFSFIDFRMPPPYMTGWAATPELALTIYRTIESEKPEQIVELGSGLSSLICAYAMEKNNKGALFSLDHDKKYGKKTKVMLSNHNVEGRVTVTHAPLKTQLLNGLDCIWYDLSTVTCPHSIDLLIVDGPPFETQKRVRYPALPYFYPKLSDSTTLIVHDAKRDDEITIIDDWLKNYPKFSKEIIDSEKGIAILRC